jgi:hypothetical protein
VVGGALGQPDGHVGRLEGLVHRSGQLVFHRRQVDRLAEPAGEGRHRRLGVIVGAMKAPVHDPLDPLAQRLEQPRAATSVVPEALRDGIRD